MIVLTFLVGMLIGMFVLIDIAIIVNKSERKTTSDDDKEVIVKAIEKLNEDVIENDDIIKGLFKILER